MPQTGSSEQEVQVCQRGWGWTDTCWFLNSIILLGQSSPAAAESPLCRDSWMHLVSLLTRFCL